MLFGLSVGYQPILQLVDLVPTGAPLARVNDARVEHDVQPFVHAPVGVVGLVLHVVHDDGAGQLGLQQLSGRSYAVVKTAVVPAVTARRIQTQRITARYIQTQEITVRCIQTQGRRRNYSKMYSDPRNYSKMHSDQRKKKELLHDVFRLKELQ